VIAKSKKRIAIISEACAQTVESSNGEKIIKFMSAKAEKWSDDILRLDAYGNRSWEPFLGRYGC